MARARFQPQASGAFARIENVRERRRGPKDAVYGWTLTEQDH